MRAAEAEVIAVLDTNSLGAQPSQLAPQELEQLVKNLPGGVRVRLLVPEVVLHERRHQMLEALQELAARIEPLERILGRSLDAAPSTVERSVDRAVATSMKALGLEELPLEGSRVNWRDVIYDAVYRKSTFEPKTEKGFRDRIVIESLRQASDLRTSRASVLVLVSRDKRLAQAAPSDLAGTPSLLIVETLTELSGVINATAAGIPPDEQAGERLEALGLFFGRPQSHFKSSAQVLEFLQGQKPEAFETLPDIAKPAEPPKVRVHAPVFSDAAMGTQHWKTPITVTRERLFQPRPTEVVFGPHVQAPGGVRTEVEGDRLGAFVEYRVGLPSGIPGFRRLVVRDWFEVSWFSHYEDDKRVWQRVGDVTYTKREYDLVWLEDAWQTADD